MGCPIFYPRLGECLFITLNKLKENHSWKSLAIDDSISTTTLENTFWKMIDLMNEHWVPTILVPPSREDIITNYTTQQAQQFVERITGRADVLIIAGDTTKIEIQVLQYSIYLYSIYLTQSLNLSTYSLASTIRRASIFFS
jgi:hypothetical protein